MGHVPTVLIVYDLSGDQSTIFLFFFRSRFEYFLEILAFSLYLVLISSANSAPILCVLLCLVILFVLVINLCSFNQVDKILSVVITPVQDVSDDIAWMIR